MTETVDPITDGLEQRLETLELKFMDLENTTQELNEVILKQYRDIERLQLQQQELVARLSSPNNPDLGASPKLEDERPPHY